MTATERVALRKAADGAIREPLDVDAILAFGLKARPEVVLALLDALDAAEGTPPSMWRCQGCGAYLDGADVYAPGQHARNGIECGPVDLIREPQRRESVALAPPPDPAEIAAVRAWDQLAGISDPVQYEPAYQKARGHVRSLLAAFDAVVRERDRLTNALAYAQAALDADVAPTPPPRAP